MRVGDVLRLDRTRITPDLAESYRQIGVYSWGKGVIENEAVLGGELSKVTYYRFPPGALILSNIQAWEAAIAVSTERQADEFIASQRFLPYVPIREGEVDTRYLLHFFLSDPGMALIRKASPGTVTRNRTLGMKAFENLTIPLLGIDEQRLIADRLDGPEIIRRAIAGADTSQSPVVERLRNRILESALQGSSEIALGELMSAATDAVQVDEGTAYPNVGIRNRGRGLFQKQDIRGAETSSGRLYPLRSGQVIYSKLFAWEGSVAIVPEAFHGHFVSSEFPHFDVDEAAVDLHFLGHSLRSAQFVAQMRRAASGMGQRRQRVNPDRFLELTVRLPERAVQTAAAHRLDEVDQVEELRRRRAVVARALPQAARNDVFSKLV